MIETDNVTEEIDEKEETPQLPIWPTLLHALYLQPGKHGRAGFTKNHGHGQSKTRRRMVKASRRRNRRG